MYKHQYQKCWSKSTSLSPLLVLDLGLEVDAFSSNFLGKEGNWKVNNNVLVINYKMENYPFYRSSGQHILKLTPELELLTTRHFKNLDVQVRKKAQNSRNIIY